MPTIVTKLNKEGEGSVVIVNEGESLDGYVGPVGDKTLVAARPHPTKPGHKVEVDGRGPHVGPHWRGIHGLRHGVIAEWVSEEELQGQAEEPADSTPQ